MFDNPPMDMRVHFSEDSGGFAVGRQREFAFDLPSNVMPCKVEICLDTHHRQRRSTSAVQSSGGDVWVEINGAERLRGATQSVICHLVSRQGNSRKCRG